MFRKIINAVRTIKIYNHTVWSKESFFYVRAHATYFNGLTGMAV